MKVIYYREKMSILEKRHHDLIYKEGAEFDPEKLKELRIVEDKLKQYFYWWANEIEPIDQAIQLY